MTKVCVKELKCMSCKHFDFDNEEVYPRCRAFPDGIPREIVSEQVDHKTPYKGDNGIQYAPKE